MSKIEYEDIIQCGHLEARQVLSARTDIGGVINLAWNIVPPMQYDPWMPVLYYPADDEKTYPPEWFSPILAFYGWARKLGKVIVHCQAGGNRSRGSLGVILIACHKMTAAQALEITGQPGYHHWRLAVEEYERAVRERFVRVSPRKDKA